MIVFVGCIVGILLILGLSQLWEWLLLCWLHPKEPLRRYDVLVLRDEDNLEQLLRYIRISSDGGRVCVVDGGLPEEKRHLCQQLCSTMADLEFCSWNRAKMQIFPENDLE